MKMTETPINSKKDSLTLWPFIVAWKAYLHSQELSKETKKNYIAGMQQLISKSIILPHTKKRFVSDNWLENSLSLLHSISDWSRITKKMRQTCLLSFYTFVKNHYEDVSVFFPAPAKPSMEVVKYVLSSVPEKDAFRKLNDDSLNKFYKAMFDRNKRDYLVCELIWVTGKTLRDILLLTTDNISLKGTLQFKDDENFYTPRYMRKVLSLVAFEAKENNYKYLFQTDSGKIVFRNQVIRTMKAASKTAGLSFEITPKILQGLARDTLSKDRRSLLQKVIDDSKSSKRWRAI